MGPMVTEMQRQKVREQVANAKESGAKVLYESDAPNKGNYQAITVLSDLKQDMLIQTDETFGPVVALATFDGSEEEAVRLANDTEYGLASYVYTCDLEKAGRVARRIRSGQVGINCYSIIKAQPKCPW